MDFFSHFRHRFQQDPVSEITKVMTEVDLVNAERDKLLKQQVSAISEERLHDLENRIIELDKVRAILLESRERCQKTIQSQAESLSLVDGMGWWLYLVAVGIVALSYRRFMFLRHNVCGAKWPHLRYTEAQVERRRTLFTMVSRVGEEDVAVPFLSDTRKKWFSEKFITIKPKEFHGFSHELLAVFLLCAAWAKYVEYERRVNYWSEPVNRDYLALKKKRESENVVLVDGTLQTWDAYQEKAEVENKERL